MLLVKINHMLTVDEIFLNSEFSLNLYRQWLHMCTENSAQYAKYISFIALDI